MAEQIKLTPNEYGGTSTSINGVKIPHVRTVRFEHVAGQAPTLTLELTTREGVEVEGWADIGGLLACPICGKQIAANREALKEGRIVGEPESASV